MKFPVVPAGPTMLLSSRVAEVIESGAEAATVTGPESVTSLVVGSTAVIVVFAGMPAPATVSPMSRFATLSSMITAAADTAACAVRVVDHRWAASNSPAVLKSNRSWIDGEPAKVPRSMRACRHAPVPSNSRCTCWLALVEIRDDADAKVGSSASVVSARERIELLVASRLQVRPPSVEISARALSRISSVLLEARCVSRK